MRERFRRKGPEQEPPVPFKEYGYTSETRYLAERIEDILEVGEKALIKNIGDLYRETPYISEFRELVDPFFDAREEPKSDDYIRAAIVLDTIAQLPETLTTREKVNALHVEIPYIYKGEEVSYSPYETIQTLPSHKLGLAHQEVMQAIGVFRD